MKGAGTAAPLDGPNGRSSGAPGSKLDRLNKTTVLALASGLGSGYSPVAPGTAGSVVGLAAAWMLAGVGHLPYLAICAAIFSAGVWAAGRAEFIYGVKDSGKITIDEVVGMMLTLWLVPATTLYLVSGFLLFRIFDIAKPFPARRIDSRMEGGLGVMLDDVVAAVYANLCLQGLYLVLS